MQKRNEERDGMMDEKTLAQVGLFTIAVIGYVFGTGIIGVLLGIEFDGNDRLFPYVAWITGAIAYGVTMVMIWK